MTEVTGRTRVWGIVADPIAQVKTPQGLNARLRARGLDGILVPFHVAAAGLAAFVAGVRATNNFGGFIATVPHKTAMLSLCDEVSASARLIGAVNAIRREPDGRLAGEMLDGIGFVAGLRHAGIEPHGQAVYLAGAGGAANAIAFALAEAGVARLTVANRTRAKVEDLKQRLARLHPDLPVEIGTPDASGHTLVVNATSLGLRNGDPLPLAADSLGPDMTVADIIMQPETTPLLAAAQASGCRAHPGQPMLDRQLDLMADFMAMTEPRA